MMISPESYYEENLKNKSADEIITKIRGLKKQIGHLKNKMEHPEYRYADMIDPSEPVQLHWTKEYLARAIQALEDAGGTYIPSKAEKNAAAFDENIPHISKIIFSIGGFFTGNNEYVISITDPIIATKKTMWSDEMPYFLVDEFEEPQSTQGLLAGMADLHLGEWRRRYTPDRFGYSILDGTQWELEIQYNNGMKPFKVYGDNIYPYNYSDFLSLLCIDDQEDDGDEDD